jgi:hypothetical protein
MLWRSAGYIFGVNCKNIQFWGKAPQTPGRLSRLKNRILYSIIFCNSAASKSSQTGDRRLLFYGYQGAFLRARKNRAFHSNSSTLPVVKSAVFPFQSLARPKNGIHAIFGHVYHSRPRGAPARLKTPLLLAEINTVAVRRAGVTFFP